MKRTRVHICDRVNAHPGFKKRVAPLPTVVDCACDVSWSLYDTISADTDTEDTDIPSYVQDLCRLHERNAYGR